MIPNLTIIVPVYKVEKYLNKCVDSILAQTYTDFEVILIDDGSPDNCGAICDEYAKKDSRVIVIHQENAGVSAARNAGLKAARGEFIGFVDSDDWIEPEMYERMLYTAEEKDVDIVFCGIFNIYDTNDITISSGVDEYIGKVLSYDEVIKITMGRKQKLFYGSVWNKVIKRSLIDNNRFNENVSLFEDWFWLIEIYRNCTSFFVTDEALYRHLDREEGLGRTVNKQVVIRGLDIEYELVKGFKKNKELYAVSAERFLDDAMLFLSRIHLYHRYTGISIKYKMLKTLMYCSINNVLPSVKINKYLVEGVIKA